MDSSSEWSRCLNFKLFCTWTWHFEHSPCSCDMLWFWSLAFLYLFWFEAEFELVDGNIRGVDTVWKEYEVVFIDLVILKTVVSKIEEMFCHHLFWPGYINCVITEVWTVLITLAYGLWSLVLFLVLHLSYIMCDLFA